MSWPIAAIIITIIVSITALAGWRLYLKHVYED